MFARGSRYEDVPTLEYQAADGRPIVYKALRRIDPAPGLTQHAVADGERIDHIAFQAYGDSERFWRICDANLAVDPRDLTATIGRVLRIPPGTPR